MILLLFKGMLRGRPNLLKKNPDGKRKGTGNRKPTLIEPAPTRLNQGAGMI
jgi:hypothetical protein